MAAWLEKTIGAVSPAWALRRAHASATLKQIRAYEGAQAGRRGENWRAASTSANAEVAPSLITIRNRARQLVRDNPYAVRAIDTLVAKSIGTGIRARFKQKQVQSVFDQWTRSGNCDFEEQLDLYGLQALGARTAFESGEVLIRRVWENDGDERVPLKLQMLEPDYIDSTKYGVSASGNVIIAGIEVDQTGRRVGYWLRKQHPGELVYVPKSLTSTFVPAEDILHFYEKRRPGQLRAVSRLAASIIRIRDLDEYEEAELVRKKIEACFVAFVHGGTSSKPLGEAVTDTDTGKRNETLSPGIIEYLRDSESVTFGTPSSSAGYGDYTSAQLHAIAVGAGVTYEQLTGDLSGVNYSSIRAGMQDFRDLVESWRWIYFVPMFCQRIEEWFLDAAWTAGLIRTKNYDAAWTAPRWAYVNPVDDIKAAKESIKAGFQSLSETQRELGYDPEEVEDEIKAERERWKAKDILSDADPATPTVTKRETEPLGDGANGNDGTGADGQGADGKGAARDVARELARELLA